MPTLIATPKATNANSYVDVATADAHLDERLYVSDWTDASTDDKERALIWATRLLDDLMDWKGTPRTNDQALRWPRSGVFDRDQVQWFDEDTIPEPLEIATAELGLELLKRDRSAEPDLLGQGFREAKLGSLEVVVDRKQVLDLIPRNILSLIMVFGDPLPGATSSGMRVLDVERS